MLCPDFGSRKLRPSLLEIDCIEVGSSLSIVVLPMTVSLAPLIEYFTYDCNLSLLKSFNLKNHFRFFLQLFSFS